MNDHIRAIKTALDKFAAEHRGVGATMTNDPPKPRITQSGLTDDVHASVYIPEFDGMTYDDRQDMVWDYLEVHLEKEHLVHLSLLQTPDAREWDDQAGMPPLDWVLPTAAG